VNRALALAAFVFALSIASDARAHPLGFGVIAIRLESTHDALVTIRVSGTEAAPGDLSVEWPAGCVGTVARDSMRDEVRERVMHVRCDDPILAQRIDVRGPSRGLETLVEVTWSDGASTRTVLGPLPTEVAIASSDSGVLEHVRLGALHFATGIDHLLFVVGAFLLARKRGVRAVAVAVTAFTIGHAITLALVATGWLVVPSRPTEACIALSLIHVAREVRVESDTTTRRAPAIVCALFGLVHGAGLASALSHAGLVGSELAITVAAFNVGLELAELALVVALFVAVRDRLAPIAERALPFVIGGVGAWLLFDRTL
jgi:hypothetical protein